MHLMEYYIIDFKFNVHLLCKCTIKEYLEECTIQIFMSFNDQGWLSKKSLATE